MALLSDHTVAAWGDNSQGELNIPASLAGKTVTSIAAGGLQALALTSDGKVTAWGQNNYGQTSVPASLNGKTVTAIAAGVWNSMALTSDGKVTVWGDSTGGALDVPASLASKTVTAIAEGNNFSLVLTSDGQLTAWGNNLYNQLNIPASLTGKTVTSIRTGWYNSAAITDDGAITVWGYGGTGITNVPASLNGKKVIDLSIGATWAMALTDDGKITAWGANAGGQLDVPTSLVDRRVTTISAGYDFGVAVSSPLATVSGTVFNDVDYSLTDYAPPTDTPIAGIAVKVAGYSFGPNGIDEDGGGDDVLIAAGSEPTTTTLADGSYAFAGLWAGKYTVTVPPQASLLGFGQTYGVAGALTVAQGDVVAGHNFGFASIPEVDAVDDAASTRQGDAVDVNVVANDLGRGLQLTGVSGAAHGTATVLNGSTVRYTPEPGWYGTEVLSYTVTGLFGVTDVANLTVTVYPIPVPVVISRNVTENSTLTEAGLSDLVTVGDGIANGVVSTPAAHGTATMVGDALSYTPSAGYTGPDQVVVTYTDAWGQTVTVTVDITVVVQPAANPNVGETGQNMPVDIDVLANDTPSGLALIAVGQPSHGQATIVAGVVHYVPEPGFAGIDSFGYTVQDGIGAQASSTVTVTVDAPPALLAQVSRTGMDRPVSIDPLAGLNSEAGVPYADIVDVEALQPAHGNVTLNQDGTLTYTPAPGYFGSDQVSVSVTDAYGQTGSAIWTVTVQEIAGGEIELTTPFQTPIATPTLSAARGTALTATSVAVEPINGTATMAADGTVTYVPAQGFSGTDRVVVVVVGDDLDQSAFVVVTITVLPEQVTPLSPPTPPVTFSPPSNGATIADTGADGSTAVLGAGIVLLGVVLLVLARRRRRLG